MLLDRFKEQFHQGYQSQITKPDQYYAAAGFLREEMQLLVEELCPEGVRIDQLSQDLDRTETALNSYEKHLQNPPVSLPLKGKAEHAQAGPQESEQLLHIQEALSRQVAYLDDAFRIPGKANYEEAQESLLQWQEKQAALQSRMAALQILTDKALRNIPSDTPPSEFPLRELGQLETQVNQLHQDILADYDLLSRVLTRHRNFILKDSLAQKQFRILNQQVAPLLKDKHINQDWYDLVQSWYKANNLANTTIKTASQQSAIFHELLTRAQGNLAKLTRLQRLCSPSIQDSDTIRSRQHNRASGDGSPLNAFPFSIQQQIDRDQELLDRLSLRIETVRTTTRQKAIDELEQVRSLWAELSDLPRAYTGRKASSAYEATFLELQSIYREPYCQRTLLHWPDSDAFAAAPDFRSFIRACNAAFLQLRLKSMEHFFDSFQGHSLTLAQRIAVLTDEDYLQIVGEKGYGKSLTLQSKAAYLQGYCDIRADQILVLTGPRAFARPALEFLHVLEPGTRLRVTTLFQEQDFIRTHIDPSSDSGLLLQCLELFLMTCSPGISMHYIEKHRLETLSETQLTPAQVQEQQLFRSFKQLVLDYLQHLQEKHLTDAYTAIRKATDLLNSGKAVCTYRYLLIDDFEQLSPYDFNLLQAMLHTNSLTKLTCTGADWQIPSQADYIQKSFPLLPRDHFLVQEILREAQYLSEDFQETKSYLSLTQTRGEVVLLSPLFHE